MNIQAWLRLISQGLSQRSGHQATHMRQPSSTSMISTATVPCMPNANLFQGSWFVGGRKLRTARIREPIGRGYRRYVNLENICNRSVFQTRSCSPPICPVRSSDMYRISLRRKSLQHFSWPATTSSLMGRCMRGISSYLYSSDYSIVVA